MHPNERAYELLRWQALAPLAEYDESVDYFSIWKPASDKALDLFDKEHERQEHPKDNRGMARPEARVGNQADTTGTSCRGSNQELSREGLGSVHEGYDDRLANRRRRKRQGHQKLSRRSRTQGR